MVQIESAAGMENVEEIAAVDGVDVLFAGPTDLSAAMGVIGQMEHEKVQSFLASFPARVASKGKDAGIPADGSGEARIRYGQGYRFVAIGDLPWSGQQGLIRDLTDLRETCR